MRYKNPCKAVAPVLQCKSGGYLICYREGVKPISKLAQVRKAQGLSQERLAELSGVHRVSIARIESGEISPNVRTLEKLADALKVTVGELIEKAG